MASIRVLSAEQFNELTTDQKYLYINEMLQKSEDVGRAFPAEARRIHNQEAPARSIRGQATDAEHAQLLDEGIAVLRLPVPPRDLMN